MGSKHIGLSYWLHCFGYGTNHLCEKKVGNVGEFISCLGNARELITS